jgi:3-demethoxyubiquinol 3-hydroxylase
MTIRRKSLPGDRPLSDDVQRMIRVNQAGEFGAVQIYKGQLAILGKSETGPLLEHMLDQEKVHLDKFNDMMVDRRVRPTVLSPLWSVFGFALGAGTALMGKKAAMACTVAVEEVIDEHYARQQVKLSGDQDPELESLITKCREEELEHKETGLAHGAEQALGYPILSSAIKGGARLAIWLSTRV